MSHGITIFRMLHFPKIRGRVGRGTPRGPDWRIPGHWQTSWENIMAIVTSCLPGILTYAPRDFAKGGRKRKHDENLVPELRPKGGLQ